LQYFALVSGEEGRLFSSFNPFGDHIEVQCFGQGQYCANNTVGAFSSQCGYKGLVNFQGVHREVFQIAQ